MRDVIDSYVTWLIHTCHTSLICGTTHSYVVWLIHMWHDSFIFDMTHSYVTWLIHIWHDSFICATPRSYVTCLTHTWPDSFICDMDHSSRTCDMTHLYVIYVTHMWHTSLIYDTTNYLWHDPFVTNSLTNSQVRRWRRCGGHAVPLMCETIHSYVKWLISKWFIHMWNDSFQNDSFTCDMTHFMRDMCHSYVTCPTHTWHNSFIYGMIHSWRTRSRTYRYVGTALATVREAYCAGLLFAFVCIDSSWLIWTVCDSTRLCRSLLHLCIQVPVTRIDRSWLNAILQTAHIHYSWLNLWSIYIIRDSILLCRSLLHLCTQVPVTRIHHSWLNAILQTAHIHDSWLSSWSIYIIRDSIPVCRSLLHLCMSIVGGSIAICRSLLQLCTLTVHDSFRQFVTQFQWAGLFCIWVCRYSFAYIKER